MPITIPTAEDLAPLTPEELAAVPIFPLPRMVFFPGTALPLHLFEARYREMIRDCITVGPAAMAVALLEPGWEEDYEGEPPIARVSGVGRIVWHEEMPDGRYNIVLVGTGRALLAPLPMDGRSYRRGAATLLAEVGCARDAVTGTLLGCASALTTLLRATDPDFQLHLPPEASPGRIADIVADRLIPDVARRQEILETLDVAKRIDLVTDAVSGALADLAPARSGGSTH
ncbi:MAG: ATP-dependent protease [Deltaproteobacteria bacterium]|nr:MAG: ATP-dependent protease [Deltaproteobacteria bacterium]